MGMTNKTRIPILEKIIDQHGERTDPMDLFTALSIIADADSYSLREFMGTSLYWDLINATQSNPLRAHNAISRMTRADDAIARYDDED